VAAFAALPGPLQAAQIRESAITRQYPRRAEHHDGVADALSAHPGQGIEILRQNPHRARGHAFHEQGVAICG
jgi:hypothetical protein